MTRARWLTEPEQRAWRSPMMMQDDLSSRIDRRLRSCHNISTADYEALAHLSEAPDGTLRPFELAALPHWEKGRLSQHLGRRQPPGPVLRERCQTDQRGAVITIIGRGSDLIAAAPLDYIPDVRDVLIEHLAKTGLRSLAANGGKLRDRLAALSSPTSSGR